MLSVKHEHISYSWKTIIIDCVKNGASTEDGLGALGGTRDPYVGLKAGFFKDMKSQLRSEE